ncbi:hypothetical protein JOB18_034024 [Solea senegalensis]|uniref:Uncharacterized protein n=1 Tax=Solea senegalensis TaxID=28829 RepID=A0AAV6SNE7_SOLSE|nr:hypothetical protein JOB18_034024 [Solea senegalensis]
MLIQPLNSHVRTHAHTHARARCRQSLRHGEELTGHSELYRETHRDGQTDRRTVLAGTEQRQQNKAPNY